MKKLFNSRITIIIFILLIIGFFYPLFLKLKNSYSINEYFPLNEGDKYIYSHHEGAERDVVTITVKNVRQTDEGKQFSLLFQGKYNDRIQTWILTSEGMKLCRNKHLVGKVPLKTIREFLPPLLMIPSRLKKSIFLSTIQSIFDYKGNLIEKENIEAEISFVGIEDVVVEAGEFKCIHFFIKNIYKNETGKSKLMHIYNFWIAPGVGYVKTIHAFVPFVYAEYVSPQKKDIMNRYNSSFVEVLELKEAVANSSFFYISPKSEKRSLNIRLGLGIFALSTAATFVIAIMSRKKF